MLVRRAALRRMLMMLYVFFLSNRCSALLQERLKQPAESVDNEVFVDPSTPTEHIVQSGETLTSIAALYQTTPSHLALANRLSMSRMVFPGDKIVVCSNASSLPVHVYSMLSFRFQQFLQASKMILLRHKKRNRISLTSLRKMSYLSANL
jgi:LysM repeat protein